MMKNAKQQRCAHIPNRSSQSVENETFLERICRRYLAPLLGIRLLFQKRDNMTKLNVQPRYSSYSYQSRPSQYLLFTSYIQGVIN